MFNDKYSRTLAIGLLAFGLYSCVCSKQVNAPEPAEQTEEVNTLMNWYKKMSNSSIFFSNMPAILLIFLTDLYLQENLEVFPYISQGLQNQILCNV